LLPDVFSPFSLFKDVEADVLRRLAACTRRSSFERGQTILRQGEACSGLHLLAEGGVEAGMQDSTGKAMTVEESPRRPFWPPPWSLRGTRPCRSR
jgi:CRP-like cAMP-binding protein